MRNNLTLAALSCLVAFASATSARAEDDGSSARITKDLSVSVGYKLWLNTWETAIPSYTNGGSHINAITAPAVAASIPNLSFKYKRFLLAGSYMTTGDYKFPAFKDTYAIGAVGYTSADRYFTASRTETDLNLGYYVTPNIVTTVGYKNVEQKYTEKIGTTTRPSSKTHYNGFTVGIGGSAAIGAGFALYGNGAYGYMDQTYTPSSTKDVAIYEASEVGIAWRAPQYFSASLGYKFQYLTSRGAIDAADVSRGYILGLNLLF